MHPTIANAAASCKWVPLPAGQHLCVAVCLGDSAHVVNSV